MAPATHTAFACQFQNYYLYLVIHSKCIIIFCGLILLFNSAESKAVVNTLPGFSGELPFLLETGYISVNDSELFYYFIESQGNPRQDPLFLWLTGGPGCSSLCGMLYEIGPIEFDINYYVGGLPKLAYYPYAWTKTASILFLDSPVGTGFSYSKTPQGWETSDSASAWQSYHFLRKWLEENPPYLLNQLFIAGDSYSGIVVPLITKLVVEGNEAGLQPRLNLKGYLVGSPQTDEFIHNNSMIPFAHRMALISDKLYEKLKTSCNGNYVFVDPYNVECLAAIAEYEQCIKGLWSNDILEPNCAYASTQKNYVQVHKKSPIENHRDFLLSLPRIPQLWCRALNYTLSYIWANDGSVQEALHVRKGKVKEWDRCNKTLSYTYDVQSVIHVHQWLSKRNLTVLVEGGDHDMTVPFLGTETWLRALNLTLVVKWRPWYVDDQVAGYTREYSENGFRLTYVTVKGAGHTAPEFNRRECYEMFQRWLHGYPL